MRKINTDNFRIATQSTSREINRRIALNVIREHQPISRADLARRMNVTRGVVTTLVNELIEQDLICEGAIGESLRGRKPTFLHVRTKDRLVVAIDVRFSSTYLMLSDFSGRQIALEIFETVFDRSKFIKDIAYRVKRMIKTHNAKDSCEGLGLVVPGMVDYKTGRILNAPALGWRNVDLRDELAAATGLTVHIENAARAFAMAEMWLGNNNASNAQSFVQVSVSDGVAVSVVVEGELLRGHSHIAGEFGHVCLSLDGPPCMCGSNGCWEAYISNLATLSRYFGRDLFNISTKHLREVQENSFTVPDLIARARAGDSKALTAILSTGRFVGLGLVSIVHGINPEFICISGEITAAWDLIEDAVREALAERALTEAAANTPIKIASSVEYPRLRGAAALIAAPTFAAPRVA